MFHVLLSRCCLSKNVQPCSTLCMSHMDLDRQRAHLMNVCLVLQFYWSGDVDRALILYSELAELGYDVAQSNMGHILDQGKNSLGSGRHEKALRVFEMSVR
jgi:hypothetical protein